MTMNRYLIGITAALALHASGNAAFGRRIMNRFTQTAEQFQARLNGEHMQNRVDRIKLLLKSPSYRRNSWNHMTESCGVTLFTCGGLAVLGGSLGLASMSNDNIYTRTPAGKRAREYCEKVTKAGILGVGAGMLILSPQTTVALVAGGLLYDKYKTTAP
jgi:hypothetical protein